MRRHHATKHNRIAVPFWGAAPSNITVYYSKDTGLAVKACYTTPDSSGTQEVETTMSDYRPVDGVLYPHRTAQKVKNVETITLIGNIKHNVVLDKDQFNLPEVIRTMVNREGGAPR